MPAIVKGLGVVFNTGAITFTAGIVSSATVANLAQSIKLARTSDKVLIKDTGGQVKAAVLSGFMKTLSLTIVPHGGTGGGAIAAGITSVETHISAAGVLANSLVGAQVTVADASGTTVVDGNWYCISAAANRSVDGVATVDIELENSDEADISATIT